MFSYTDYMRTPMNYPGNPAFSGRPESGTGVTSSGREVKELTPDQVLKHFEFTREEKRSRMLSEVVNGAKNFAKKSWKIGLVLGMEFGLASNIICGVLFPPSLMALALSTFGGMAVGAAIGTGVGAIAGVAVRGTLSALYLAAKSPEQRLAYAAKKGQKRLNQLYKKQEKGNFLGNKEQQELRYLEWHVNHWIKASEHFAAKALAEKSQGKFHHTANV